MLHAGAVERGSLSGVLVFGAVLSTHTGALLLSTMVSFLSRLLRSVP